MVNVINGVVYITRGDDADFDVALKFKDGTEYTMQDGDVLTFTVRQTAEQTAAEIFSVTSETPHIRIPHIITDEIEAGYYSCDLQLTCADGDVQTVFPAFDDRTFAKTGNRKNFVIGSEVTHE